MTAKASTSRKPRTKPLNTHLLRNAATGGTTQTHTSVLVEKIRALVLDGEIASGSRVNELSLSQTFSVSRTPIRSALQTLAGEGLLDYTPNRGYTVPSIALSDILDAYELRALTEGLSARLAAERGLPEMSQLRIAEALSQGDKLFAGKGKDVRGAYGAINEIFHGEIQRAARSRLVQDVIRLCVRTPQAAAKNLVAFSVDEAANRHVQHREIFEAIVGREPVKAETLMRQHVLNVRSAVLKSAISGRNFAPATSSQN